MLQALQKTFLHSVMNFLILIVLPLFFNQPQITAHVPQMTTSAATDFASPKKRSATGTSTVGTSRTKTDVREPLAICPNLDVPTAKSA